MSQATKIEWTDETWNPTRGCSRVSEGCRNCYAERLAARFTTPRLKADGASELNAQGSQFYGFAQQTAAGPRWTGRVELVPEKLDEPLRRRRWAERFAREHGRRPRVFVNSMSDLFHEALSDESIAAVFGVMAAAPWIDFQILTKRPERMRRWFEWLSQRAPMQNAHGITPAALCFWNAQKETPNRAATFGVSAARRAISVGVFVDAALSAGWPLPNVWLGTSVEDQPTADERIPHLLATPAAVRFVSYEPALGAVDFCYWLSATALREIDGGAGLDWLIVGGESGPGARPFDLAWARSVVAQCKAAEVACFVKQLGARPFDSDRLFGRYAPHDRRTPVKPDGWGGEMDRGNLVLLRDRKGGDMNEWPEDLRVREFPK